MPKTPLLTLQPLSKKDWKLFEDLYTDEYVMKHIGPSFGIEKTRRLFNQILSENSQDRFYVIKKTTSKNSIGIIGLLRENKGESNFQLGVMILNVFNNYGYAYKATKMLINHAFCNLNVTSIWVSCHTNNTAANRIANALGFIQQNDEANSNNQVNQINWEITIERYKTTRR